jgi:cell shape-determining protein MreC
MKTNYLQKNKKQIVKNRFKQIAFVIILILVLFFSGSFIRGSVHFFNIPITFTEKIIIKPFSTFFNYLSSKDNLARENNILEEEIKKLNIEMLTVNSVRGENQDLKEILGYNKKISDYALAKVLNKPPVSPFDTLVIDIDQEKSVLNQKVYFSNLPVGYIFEIYKNSSIVKLYSSSDERVSVNIGEIIKNVEAKGVGSGTFRIEIPKDIGIKEGDIVSLVTGEVIGLVEGIEMESSNTFQNVYFKYPFVLKDMNWVLVRLGEL